MLSNEEPRRERSFHRSSARGTDSQERQGRQARRSLQRHVNARIDNTLEEGILRCPMNVAQRPARG